MRLEVVPGARFGEVCADEFLGAMAIDKSPFFGLPTGSTPQPMYAELRYRAEFGRANIERVYAVAIDEYAGPRDHAGSNHAYFREHWMTIPGARPVFEFDTRALDYDIEAARMEDLVHTLKGLSAAFLGIGLNGHLAFNEPGTARHALSRVVELSPESRGAAAAVWGERTPWLGLTLGLGVLLQAKRVYLLASGPHKAHIINRALTGEISADCPASFVQDHHDSVVILDEEAASELPRSLVAAKGDAATTHG